MSLKSIEGDWDIVVVGGGVTGAGVFRESTGRGLKALLVEQKDFAWGTSSRSSKLVHGGLRYLKEGKFALTRESVRERERLIREAPGLVKRLEFRLPIYRGLKPGALTMGVGLTLYDLISGKRSYRYYGRSAYRQIEPLVSTQDLQGGFSFTDAQVDDARLVLCLIATAERAGGLALNYTRVTGLERDNSGNVRGVFLEDTESKEQVFVQTRLVINATGVWAEGLHPSPEKNKHLRPLRGSHLIFPKELIPIETAVSFFSPHDGRQQFAFPWEGAVLVGTTDIDHKRALSEEPAAAEDEVAYLLEGINTIFPSLKLTSADAVSSFAGVRPVVSEGKVSADKESREHVIWKDRGLVTVTGGKLTTFRVLARDALFAARDYLPSKGLREPSAPIFEPWTGQATPAGLSFEAHQRLWGRYGSQASVMLANARAKHLRVIAGTQTLLAELPHAAAREKIRHLDDLLLRRVRIGLLLPEGGKAHLDEIRALCRPVMSWSDARWDSEIENYLRMWRTHYRPCRGQD
ncbi:MAG: glycerol-3-phosphate dehydrogenase/oxidase [Syntrophobacteraceae bacterium]